MRLARTLAVATLSALILTACSNDTNGSPQPTGGESPETSDGTGIDLPHSGAPAVDNPVTDTSDFESDPCSILPPDQLKAAEFEIDESLTEQGRDDSEAPGCSWFFDEAGHGSFITSLASPEAEGLSHIFQLQEDGHLGVFEELEPINGHPVVIAAERDEREQGTCSLYIGIRDDLALYLPLTASRDNPLKEAPCEAAYELATIAVDTITGGA